MRVITTNPVLQSGVDKSPSEMYYNFPSGSLMKFNENVIQSQKEKGLTWDKVKGAWVKAQESGLIDKGKELLGGLFGKGKPKGKPPVSTSPKGSGKPKKPSKKGMSTTTMILIGVGVLVVGFAIYKLSKNK